jgi:hypothetical protein
MIQSFLYRFFLGTPSPLVSNRWAVLEEPLVSRDAPVGLIGTPLLKASPDARVSPISLALFSYLLFGIRVSDRWFILGKRTPLLLLLTITIFLYFYFQSRIANIHILSVSRGFAPKKYLVVRFNTFSVLVFPNFPVSASFRVCWSGYSSVEFASGILEDCFAGIWTR